MKALVLSGGNIKGAYQAGVLKSLAETGWSPDITFGISVGALHTYVLSYRMEYLGESFEQATNYLADFWIKNIKNPKSLVSKRSWIKLGWDILTGEWEGLTSLDPLKSLLIKECPNVDFIAKYGYVGVYDLFTRQQEYYQARIDTTMASAQEPIIMKGTRHTDSKGLITHQWCDGGVNDIAPLSSAIKSGATEIVVISNQSQIKDPHHLKDPKKMSLMETVSFIIDAFTDEILSNDLRECIHINERVLSGEDIDHQFIDLKVIRPLMPFNKVDVASFTPKDIEDMFNRGYDEDIKGIL